MLNLLILLYVHQEKIFQNFYSQDSQRDYCEKKLENGSDIVYYKFHNNKIDIVLDSE